MKNPVSVISFVRRQLKVRGKSRHNGRGCVEMEHDCADKDELADRICVAQARWIKSDLVTKTVQHGECWHITFADHADLTRDNYYRTLVYNAVRNTIYVVM